MFEPAVDVALEAVVLGSLDGGAFEEGAVLLLGEALPVVGCHLQEGFGGLEGLLCCGLCFGELRRCTQAAVAAIEGALELYLFGQRTAMFDGLVADAAAGIEAVGGEGRAEQPLPSFLQRRRS